MGDEYKVGDKVVITKQGDGCGDTDHGCNGGPGVGTVCVIGAISTDNGLPCGPFLLDYDGASWWTTSGHFIPYTGDPIVGPELPEPKPEPEPVGFETGATVKSLHPGSGSLYLLGHIRVDGTTVRVQGRLVPGAKGWEGNAPASVKLRGYIADRPHGHMSVANTPTMYARCRFRLDGDKLRVQVAGPAFNRDWGAEFCLSGNWPTGKLVPQAVAQPEPASTGAPLPTLSTNPSLDNPGFLGPHGDLSSICENCGHSCGEHYPGGDDHKFSPTLCPETGWTCPDCGVDMFGPEPFAIHKAFECKTAEVTA